MPTVPGLSIYQEAERQQLDRDWQALQAGEASVKGVRQDAQGMQGDIAGAISLTQGITPEGKRITYDASPPEVQSGANQVIKGLTGSTIEELRSAMSDPEQVMKLVGALDPVGNLSRALVEERMQASGLPAEKASQAAGLASMILGAMYGSAGASKTAKGPLLGERLPVTVPQAKPGGSAPLGAAGALGAGAAAGLAAMGLTEAEAGTSAKDLRNPKKIVERLKAILSGGGESRINTGRVNAKKSVKIMMEQINAAEGDALAESRRVLPHSEVLKGAKQIPIGDVLKANLEQYDSSELRTAARAFNVGATRRTERLMKQAMKGDEKAAVDLLAAYPLAGQLSYIHERLGTIQARSLAAGKIQVGGNLNQKGMSRLYQEMRQAAEQATAGTEMATTSAGPIARRTPTGEVVAQDALARRAAGEVVEGSTDVGRRTAQGEIIPETGLDVFRGEADIHVIRDALVNELGQGDEVKAGLMLARRLSVMTPEQRAEVGLNSTSLIRKLGRGFYSAWIESLLSGPQTHVANMTSNAITAAMAPPERFLAAAMDGWFKDREIFFGESTAMAGGMFRAIKDGFKMAGESLKTGETAFGPSKVRELGSLINPQVALGGQADSAVVSAVEHLKMFLPSRWMTAEDELWKIINFGGEFESLALRESRLRGYTGGTAKDFIARVHARPQDYPDIVEQAEVAALERTFNGPTRGVVGAFADAAMSIRNKYPAFGIVVPFIRTPANILQFSIERTPGLNLLSSAMISDLRAGGATAALARGKLGMSGVIAGSFAMYASTPVPGGHWYQRGMKGIPEGQPIPFMTMITGAGPADPQMRKMLETELGWKPYAIWVDGEYRSYVRLDPWGTVLGLIADTAEIYGSAPEHDIATLAGSITLALSKFTEEKTFMQGAAQIFATLDGLKQGRAGAASAWARGVAGSVVPGFVAQTNRELFDRNMHEVRTVVDAMRARTWGFSGDVQKRYNLFGREQFYSHGWVPFKGDLTNANDTPGLVSMAVDLLSPVKMSKTRLDENSAEFKAAAEIAKLRMSIQPTPERIGGAGTDVLGTKIPNKYEGVALTAREREEWTLLASQERLGGRNLAEDIVHLMERTVYQVLPPNTKALQIHNLINEHRNAAEQKVLAAFPELKAKVEIQRGAGIDIQRKVTDPRSPFKGVTDSGEQVRMQAESIRQLGQSLKR